MNILRTASPRGGIWLRLVVFLAVLFAGLAMAWMILLPYAVTRYVHDRTGFGIGMQTLYVNPFTANLALRGLVITNPPAFPTEDFVEVREFCADVRLFSLFEPRLVIDDAVINVAAISLVKDQRGLTNVSLFQEGLVGSSSTRPPVEAKQKEREFLVRRLQVRFDRLVIADYSGRRPDVHEFNCQLSHDYENITSARQLTALLADIFAPVAGAISGIPPGTPAALRAAGDPGTETGRKAGEAVKEFFEALEKTLKK